MTRIVRSAYRYKRPPSKRKAVPLEVPAVVTISDKTRRRVSDRPPVETAADVASPPAVASDDGRKPVIARTKVTRASSATAPVPSTNDDRKPAIKLETAQLERKSAIVTARRPGKRRYADVPEVTEDEHRALGDRADAMMQDFKRQIAEKLRTDDE